MSKNRLYDTESEVTHAKPVRTPVVNGIPKKRDPVTGRRVPDEFFAIGGQRDVSAEIDKASKQRP